MKRTLSLAIAALAVMALSTACTVEMHNVPAGFVGRILTPTGWDATIAESGQIDLKSKDNQGRYAVLVLMESTTTTVKEQFLAAGQDPKRKTDGTDHRILTKNGTPLSVDFYVRCMLPDDKAQRNNARPSTTNTHPSDHAIRVHARDSPGSFKAYVIMMNATTPSERARTTRLNSPVPQKMRSRS